MTKTIKYAAAIVIVAFLALVTNFGAKPIFAIIGITILMSSIFFADMIYKRDSTINKK